MTEERPVEVLTCTKIVRRDNGRNQNTGKIEFYHEKCGLPASEVEIGGLLTKAKAVLCGLHKSQADKQAFISVNGYPKGKISRDAKREKYNQSQLPGTGIV